MDKTKLKKNIVSVFLVLMCIQIVPLEGSGVSNLKFATMCLAPFIWMFYFKTFSKAFVWGFIYILMIIFSVLYNIDSLRLSTLGYKIAFVFMFIMYYDLIYFNNAFSLQEFIKFLKFLIWAFVVCLILQQVAILVGLRSLALINFVNYIDRGIGANSLSIEPSHAARILTVLMLVFIKMSELKTGKENFIFFEFYKNNKKVLLGFLWAMLTMGSGTAFVGLALILLYFVKTKYTAIVGPLLLILYFLIPYINYESFDRAKLTFETFITLDNAKIIEADRSAAARIVPLVNTFTKIEVTKLETWIGEGIDSHLDVDYLSNEKIIGDITDYGLISYIFSLFFVFSCCIHKVKSIETILFIFLLGASILNIAYVWGILMLFSTSNYFLNNYKKGHFVNNKTNFI
ncbi:hypothetical protein OAD06_02290 [Flavobacteriaceae bacterium]|nr:hypothetical protein [Flavobacteriaceae bacterium]